MKKNKRIIFFVTGLSSGGLENYLLRFIRDYYNRFDKIYVWCKGGIGGVLEKDYGSLANVTIIKVSLNSVYFWKYLNLMQFIKLQKINVVCDFTGSFSGFTMLSSSLMKVPVRLAFYRNADDKFNKFFYKVLLRKLIQKFTEKYSTKILSNSKSALNYFYPKRSKNSLKFRVIYNGINSKQFKQVINYESKLNELEIPNGSFIIGHVGRFNSQKNHKTILAVYNSLIKNYDDIYLVLCGSGTKKGVLNLINKINPKMVEKVKLLGNRSDINELLQIMNVFLFPSTIEGQPNALIEAMISGVPIVTSNIQPIIETTPERMHRFLKDPFDVDGYVDLIKDIYSKPKFKSRFLCEDWASTNFNHENRFKDFYNEISAKSN